jgi:hypothetical protein
MKLGGQLRDLGLGRWWLALYHQPKSQMRDLWREGGPWGRRETEQQRALMEAAADGLPPLPHHPDLPRVSLHFLTGRRFWYQTAFCLHSLGRVTPDVTFEAHIYDDGTIDDATAERLQRLGPGIAIHSLAELNARIDAVLPEHRFPALRERRRNYPHLRKLTDVHAGQTGWKLVLDSDLLFFRRPAFMLDWLAAPDRPFHAVDCQESYGYSRALMAQLAARTIPPLVNVGLCGWRSEELDWERLEFWCAQLLAREKTNYYLEQALVAMLVAGRPAAIAPRADYLTKPSLDEARHPQAVMHHYVDTSKAGYFRHAWRQVLTPSI